jgi:hypothetical protein
MLKWSIPMNLPQVLAYLAYDRVGAVVERALTETIKSSIEGTEVGRASAAPGSTAFDEAAAAFATGTTSIPLSAYQEAIDYYSTEERDLPPPLRTAVAATQAVESSSAQAARLRAARETDTREWAALQAADAARQAALAAQSAEEGPRDAQSDAAMFDMFS